MVGGIDAGNARSDDQHIKMFCLAHGDLSGLLSGRYSLIGYEYHSKSNVSPLRFGLRKAGLG